MRRSLSIFVQMTQGSNVPIVLYIIAVDTWAHACTGSDSCLILTLMRPDPALLHASEHCHAS